MSLEWQFALRVCGWIELACVIIGASIWVGVSLYRVISSKCWDLDVDSSTPEFDLEAQLLEEDESICSKIMQGIDKLWKGFFLLHFGMAILLLQATESVIKDMNVNPESASIMCKVWRAWTVGNLINLVGADITIREIKMVNWVFVILRGTSLCIVYRYIAELEAV